jgi:hypothetical protein
MSHNLARLRALFGDELLTRGEVIRSLFAIVHCSG